MTEVDLVAVALATGAAAGLTETGRGALHDLYARLSEAVRRRLTRSGGYGVRVLDAYEADPDVWQTRLLQVLRGPGVETDEEILAAARAVIRAERWTGDLGRHRRGTGEGTRHAPADVASQDPPQRHHPVASGC
ncbi:hypothetical protein [Streptomyces sp. NBC_01445]|uniref:hypothetical protein n=1 Tax=Streptomyces sp. NBC_01445 TaxID=2903869 RepID=UPI002DD7FB2E|nr:hypothetical protein [Streptomyces sp. NBC_01445]WSE03748.1 hypothetical protein OG574_10435 [Streptomyces sp. NBC_01445]